MHGLESRALSLCHQSATMEDKLQLSILFFASIHSITYGAFIDTVKSIISATTIKCQITTTLFHLDLTGDGSNRSSSTSVTVTSLRTLESPVLVSSEPVTQRMQSFFLNHNHLIVVETSDNIEKLTAALSCNNYCLYMVVCSGAVLRQVQLLSAFQRLKHKVLIRRDDGDIIPSLPGPSYGFDLKRFELRNQHVRLYFPRIPPYFVATSEGKGMLGVCVESIFTTSELFNFTYDYEVVTGGYGTVIRDLQAEKIDFVLSGLPPSTKLYGVIGYGTFGFQNDMTFVTGQPSIDLDWASFIHPFSLTVWILLLAILFALASVFAIMYAVTGVPHPLTEACLTALAPLLSQSIRVHASAARLVILWLFVSMSIESHYSSDLLSYITHPSYENIPEDFHELANRNDYALEMINIPNAPFVTYFETSSNPTVSTIRRRYNLNLNHNECVIRAATETKTACIGPSGLLFPIINHRLSLHSQFEPLIISQKPITRFFINSILQRDSRYLDAVDFIVGWGRDTGLIWKWKDNVYNYYRKLSLPWLNNEGFRVKAKLEAVARRLSHSHVHSFGTGHLYMAFGVLAVGVALSSGALALENVPTVKVMWKRRKSARDVHPWLQVSHRFP